MPVEVTKLEDFIEITGRAVECRVKKNEKSKTVKVKARTKKYLYTYKTTEDKLSEVLGKVKCKRIVYVDEGKVEERKQ